MILLTLVLLTMSACGPSDKPDAEQTQASSALQIPTTQPEMTESQSVPGTQPPAEKPELTEGLTAG